MGAIRIFLPGGANSGFSKKANNIFSGWPKGAKLHFHHSKIRKQAFLQKFLSFFLKITKIYLARSI